MTEKHNIISNVTNDVESGIKTDFANYIDGSPVPHDMIRRLVGNEPVWMAFAVMDMHISGQIADESAALDWQSYFRELGQENMTYNEYLALQEQQNPLEEQG